MFPVLAVHHAIRPAPAAVKIYQYDSSPAAGRKPLLIIHGLLDEYTPSFRMQWICRYLLSDPTFQKRYKIFLARYNTTAPEKKSEESFKSAIRELSAEQKGPVVIVALSFSGNIVRNAMSDSTVDKAISQVIAIGTPFHGSPFFSRDWMVYTFSQSHKWPTTFFRNTAYRLYFRLHPNILSDYCWDNCDGQIPSVGRFKYDVPFAVQGELSPQKFTPQGVSASENGEKFTAYGSYIETHLTNKHSDGLIAVPHAIALFLRTTLPAYFGHEHAMLKVMNYDMARAVVRDESRAMNYAFNDGICPAISAISCTVSGAQECNLTDEKQLEGLKSKVSVKKARLFANADHVSFIDGRGPYGRRIEIQDKLNPDEKPRPIFAWLLSDLLLLD